MVFRWKITMLDTGSKVSHFLLSTPFLFDLYNFWLSPVATTPEAFLAVVNNKEQFGAILEKLSVTRASDAIDQNFFVAISDPFKALAGPVTEVSCSYPFLSSWFFLLARELNHHARTQFGLSRTPPLRTSKRSTRFSQSSTSSWKGS